MHDQPARDPFFDTTTILDQTPTANVHHRYQSTFVASLTLSGQWTPVTTETFTGNAYVVCFSTTQLPRGIKTRGKKGADVILQNHHHPIPYIKKNSL